MEKIIIAIQDRLAAVDGLKYIDKDWNQIAIDNPPVKFPCALIDVQHVEFAQLHGRGQHATADIDVVVANLRLVNSSLMNPRRAEAHLVLRLMDEVNALLHGWHAEGFGPLLRTGIDRIAASPGMEAYAIHYRTTW